MDELFDLTFYNNDEDRESGFHIGLFSTREEAESVAVRYMKEVPGFRDYDCIPRVCIFPVIGGTAHTRQVYRFEGWNTDEDLEEFDIINSNCFADRNEAENALLAAKVRTPRENWVLNRHVIGQCGWAEGFVRVYPEDEV